MTVLDPGPFLRGVPWPSAGRVPHPRADPADRDRLPRDTWARACLPVGVRLEWVGDATEVVIEFDPGDHARWLPWRTSTSFSVWCGGDEVASVPADVAVGRVAISGLPGGVRCTVYPPEGVVARVTSVHPVDGSLDPAPADRRWLSYGDSIVEGWVASEPARAWPSIVARRHGLDVDNLGYAGAARGEIPTAEQIARLPADVITVAYGTNCWTRTPHSIEMMLSGFDAFLTVVRQGHPLTPMVVVSPIARPDAEGAPNRLGATLADLRLAIEDATRDRIAGGDGHLSLVEGAKLLAPDALPDGIHPGDEGHAEIAAAVGPELAAALARKA